MRSLFLIFIVSLLTSCATKVTSIKQDKDIPLESNQGYLLIGIETNRDLKSVIISGPNNIKLTKDDLKKGDNYLLVDLKAGEYSIERAELDNIWRLSFDDDYNWEFKITPNVINYVGHLEIARRSYYLPYTNVKLVNRSSEALEYLEENYPNILASREISYGGPGEDLFYNYLKKMAKE